MPYKKHKKPSYKKMKMQKSLCPKEVKKVKQKILNQREKQIKTMASYGGKFQQDLQDFSKKFQGLFPGKDDNEHEASYYEETKTKESPEYLK